MEPRDHFKNGASLKSQTSKRNILRKHNNMAKLRECTIDPSDYKVCNNCKAIFPSSYNQCPKCHRTLEKMIDRYGKEDYEVER